MQPGIEPTSSWSLVNTLPTRPMSQEVKTLYAFRTAGLNSKFFFSETGHLINLISISVNALNPETNNDHPVILKKGKMEDAVESRQNIQCIK